MADLLRRIRIWLRARNIATIRRKYGISDKMTDAVIEMHVYGNILTRGRKEADHA